jgi:hypothetical protein
MSPFGVEVWAAGGCAAGAVADGGEAAGESAGGVVDWANAPESIRPLTAVTVAKVLSMVGLLM